MNAFIDSERRGEEEGIIDLLPTVRPALGIKHPTRACARTGNQTVPSWLTSGNERLWGKVKLSLGVQPGQVVTLPGQRQDQGAGVRLWTLDSEPGSQTLQALLQASRRVSN